MRKKFFPIIYCSIFFQMSLFVTKCLKIETNMHEGCNLRPSSKIKRNNFQALIVTVKR